MQGQFCHWVLEQWTLLWDLKITLLLSKPLPWCFRPPALLKGLKFLHLVPATASPGHGCTPNLGWLQAASQAMVEQGLISPAQERQLFFKREWQPALSCSYGTCMATTDFISPRTCQCKVRKRLFAFRRMVRSRERHVLLLGRRPHCGSYRKGLRKPVKNFTSFL